MFMHASIPNILYSYIQSLIYGSWTELQRQFRELYLGFFFKPKKKHRKKVYQENSFNLVCVHHSPKDYCTVQFILPSVHFPFSHPLSIPFLLYPTLSPPYPSNLFPNPYPSPLSVYNPTHFLHLSTIKPLPPFLTLTMEIYIPNCHWKKNDKLPA